MKSTSENFTYVDWDRSVQEVAIIQDQNRLAR